MNLRTMIWEGGWCGNGHVWGVYIYICPTCGLRYILVGYCYWWAWLEPCLHCFIHLAPTAWWVGAWPTVVLHSLSFYSLVGGCLTYIGGLVGAWPTLVLHSLSSCLTYSGASFTELLQLGAWPTLVLQSLSLVLDLHWCFSHLAPSLVGVCLAYIGASFA